MRKGDQIWPRVVLVFAVLVTWAVFASSMKIATPADTWSALTSHFLGGDGLLAAAGRSLLRLAVGLGVGVVVGTPLGLWMASSKSIQRSIGSGMVALQVLPPIVWLPLAILWFGLTVRAVLFVVILAAIPAVAVGTAAAVRLVPPTLVRAGQTIGASRGELYRRIVLPAAVPGYIVGLRQAWMAAWWALLAGELVTTGARGIGHFMGVATPADGVPTLDTSLLLAVMIVIMGVGLAVDAGFAVVDRRIRSVRGLL